MLTRSRRRVAQNIFEQSPPPPGVQNDSERASTGNDFDGVISKAIQNVLILEKISSYLSFSDLKIFRLVSRQWNQESLQVIRKRVGTITIVFGSFSMLKNYRRLVQITNNWGQKTCNEIDEFISKLDFENLLKIYGKTLLQLIQKSSAGFPCTKFAVTTELPRMDRKLFYNFLETISSFATKLKLHAENDNVSIDMHNLQFPFLREFKIWMLSLSTVKIKEMLKCFQHLIYNAPVLDKINLAINDDLGQLTLDFLGAINSSPICVQLRTLDIETDVLNEHFFVLRDMGLRQQKLAFLISIKNKVNTESLISFLESQSQNLEELSLKYNYRDVSLRLPRMQKLLVLNLLQVSSFSLPGLSFSRDLPALKHLEFGGSFCDTFKFSDFFSDTMEPVNTVETLVIPVALDNFEIMNRVARIFPKLKKLQCQSPKKITQSVGDGLANLEDLSLDLNLAELYIEVMHTFNLFMTGYLASELKEIEKSGWAGGGITIDGNKQPNGFLQKLKILRIHDGEITDVHCLLGPLKLPSIQCFDLSKSIYSKVNQRVLEQMRKKFLVKIDEKSVIFNEHNGI